MKNEEAIVALIKTDGKVYLMMDSGTPSTIIGFESISKGIHYFEDAYNDNHNRSYESSMSACINYIFFQPSIVVFKDGIEYIEKILEQPVKLWSTSNISGRILGLPLKKAFYTLWDEGDKPKLI